MQIKEKVKDKIVEKGNIDHRSDHSLFVKHLNQFETFI